MATDKKRGFLPPESVFDVVLIGEKSNVFLGEVIFSPPDDPVKDQNEEIHLKSTHEDFEQ